MVRTILSDLVAEQQSLDQYLQKIPVRDWSIPTAVKGWDIRDIVSHLAHFEELAAQTVAGETPPIPDGEFINDLYREGVLRGREIRPQDVIEWWRKGRASLIEPLSEMAPSQEIPWIAGPVSAQTVAVYRLTDTWAYGLDIYEAMGDEYEDTTRIRHICWLGWATLAHQFHENARGVPTRPGGGNRTPVLQMGVRRRTIPPPHQRKRLRLGKTGREPAHPRRDHPARLQHSSGTSHRNGLPLLKQARPQALSGMSDRNFCHRGALP